MEGKTTHPLVKAVVVFHLIAIVSWSLPEPIPPVRNQQVSGSILDQIEYQNDKYLQGSFIFQYIQTPGLFHAWDMFAPDPTNRNVWGDAVVEFEDGTTEVVPYPRIATYPILIKVQKERYRKFYERAHLDYYNFMWPDFAQRMAYLAAKSPKNPPRMVRLRRHLKFTPPTMTAAEYFSGFGSRQGIEKWLPASPQVAGPFPEEPYFDWVVNQEQLFRAKGWR